MVATLEKVDSIRRRISVGASKETVDRARKAVLDKMRAELNIPGFRKGKVPDEMILKKYGDEVNTETIKKIVHETYPQAVSEVGANPISPPSVEPVDALEPGKPFSYRATFEIYPEVLVGEYEKLPLEREKVSVSDEEVEMELKKLQMQLTQLEPSPDGKVSKGMIAMIDFKGTAAGEPFPGSEAENYVVDFGSGNLLKEFEVQIEGMKMDEERVIEFDYPEDYFRKDIAGKRGRFTVKTKDVRRKIVPKIDDDFAKELGQYKTLKDVKADLKKRIHEYKELMVRNQLMEQAIRKLIEKHKDMDVPTTLIESELGNMIEQLKRRMEAQGQKFEESKIEPKEFVKANVKEATDRARGYMLVSAISAKEGVVVSDDEVEARIGRIAAQTRQPVEKVKQQAKKDNQLEALRSQIMFEKTLDLILNKAKIKEVKPKKAKKS